MKDNKIIAEFMGFTKDSKDLYLIDDYNLRSEDEYQATYVGEMKFHTSWDWLMPVVERIESLGIVSFEKNLQEEGDYQALFTKGYDILICHYADTSIEATYRAVFEFINTYKEV
tara:strand:- start:172 stop:513 length:342 start_codon:yes stop_codon:yes gene_type:complete